MSACFDCPVCGALFVECHRTDGDYIMGSHECPGAGRSPFEDDADHRYARKLAEAMGWNEDGPEEFKGQEFEDVLDWMLKCWRVTP